MALKQIFQMAFGCIVLPSSSLFTVLVSQYLNAFCLRRGLIEKSATETVLPGFAKKNLFLINITRGASPLGWSWDRTVTVGLGLGVGGASRGLDSGYLSLFVCSAFLLMAGLQGVICFSDPAVISKVSRICKLLNWEV